MAGLVFFATVLVVSRSSAGILATSSTLVSHCPPTTTQPDPAVNCNRKVEKVPRAPRPADTVKQATNNPQVAVSICEHLPASRSVGSTCQLEDLVALPGAAHVVRQSLATECLGYYCWTLVPWLL